MKKSFLLFICIITSIGLLSACTARRQADEDISVDDKLTEATGLFNSEKINAEEDASSDENGVSEQVNLKNVKSYYVDVLLTDEQFGDIVYVLTKRANEITTEAVVTYRSDEEHGYIIDIELPFIEDDTIFADLVKKNNLEIISNFQEDNQAVELTGKDVKSAVASVVDKDGIGVKEPIVCIELNEEGTEKFAKVTTEHIREILTICLNGEVLSSPMVMAPITNGQVWISGLDSFEEASTLAKLINSSGLDYELIEMTNK